MINFPSNSHECAKRLKLLFLTQLKGDSISVIGIACGGSGNFVSCCAMIVTMLLIQHIRDYILHNFEMISILLIRALASTFNFDVDHRPVDFRIYVSRSHHAHLQAGGTKG